MRAIIRLLPALLISGLILSLSTPAQAARSYLIELVVFSNQQSNENEKWITVHPPLHAGKMARAVRPDHVELVLQKELPEIKESTFSTYVSRLKKSPGREVILSTHWVQPVLEPANTMIVRITDSNDAAAEQTGTVVDRKDPSAGNPTTARRSAFGTSGGSFSRQRQPVAKPILDGYVNFYLDGQYTLEADLRYTPPYRPSILDENPDSGPVSYRIFEKRRMKSGELNYYDHPKFGMVLLVTPVEGLAD